MSRFKIDIPASIKSEKLVIKEWVLSKISDYLLYSFFVLSFPFVSFITLISSLNKNEPIAYPIFFLILSLILSSFLIYSIVHLNSLKRIRGISRENNSDLIKTIAKKNNWDFVNSKNEPISFIYFSWKKSLTESEKQITILYDKKDILVNCISFGMHSSRSPFHWFANTRKVNQLKTEFENGIKTFYNNG